MERDILLRVDGNFLLNFHSYQFVVFAVLRNIFRFVGFLGKSITIITQIVLIGQINKRLEF